MKSTCDCCGDQISAPHRVQEDNGRDGWVCAKCWKRVCNAADWGHQGRGKLFFAPSGPPEGERAEKNGLLSLQVLPHKPRDPNDDIPGWLKKVLKERGGKIEDAARRALSSPDAQVDWPEKLGCGHYGCAWGILEPGGDKPRYVVKITRDPTEGPMQATIAKRQQAGDYGFEDGFAIVRGVYRLEPDVSWKGKMWPVYAIVREEVAPILSLSGKGVMFYGHMGAESRDEDVPGIYPKVTRAQLGRAIDALHAYKDVAAKWYAQKALKRPKQYKIDDLESKMQEHLNRISDWLPTVGTVMGILQEEGTPLRDVHANNVGVRRHEGVVSPDDPKNGIGYPCIFDPGHLPNSDEEAERGIARLNPDAFDSFDAFGHAPAKEGTPGFHLDELKRGDVVRVGKTVWDVRQPGGRLVYKHGTSGKKMYQMFNSGEPGSVEVYEINGMAERVGGPVARGSASVEGRAAQNPGDAYELPAERLMAATNPTKGFADAFGIPYEAHLVPVWPAKRRKNEPKITGPEALARYLSAVADMPQEQFMIALLDQAGKLIGVVIASKGTLNEAAVHPREVFASAISARAAGIILVHNHPSGEVTPSSADVAVSQRLHDVGEIVGIPIVDHLVLGRGGEYVGLRSLGAGPWRNR